MAGAEAIVAQLAQQLRTVRFDKDEYPTRYVTAWISGERQPITFARSYGSLVGAVAVVFEIDKMCLRIYVLQFPNDSPWKDKIRLTEGNFEDYISERGTFEKTSKLYVCDDTSPDG